MTIGCRKAGHFCWINVISPQLKESKEFYAELLGWTFDEEEGGNFAIYADGRRVGSLVDRDHPNAPEGTPSHIEAMVKVGNVGAMVEKVQALGGKLRMTPLTLAGKGRVAHIEDPNGARFIIWAPESMHGMEADSAAHGGIAWFETLTTDVEKATTFYSSLFGWLPTVTHDPCDYTTFSLDGVPVAGLMKSLGTESQDPHWGISIAVTDVDETADVAQKLGATLTVAPTDMPGIGRFCMIVSMQGVAFSAIKFAPSEKCM